MTIQNAEPDIPKLLSRSFKSFSSFITGFIQLGKEPRTSSMVQSLIYPFLPRSFQQKYQETSCSWLWISTPKQAETVTHYAVGVIVGSPNVKVVEASLGNPDLIAKEEILFLL